jgi:universal bacterial protein YeaZ
MRILGIDSSGLVATVAVIDEKEMVAEYTVNYKKTHSQTLLPMIDEIVKMIELDLDTIDAIAISAGPGSFTGLRIGSATAKGLGLALNKPLISVPTVDGLAFNLYSTEKIICPIMDARRSQVYTGIYTFIENQFTILEPQMAVSIQEIAKKLNTLEKEVIFLGDGVPVYKEILATLMTTPYTFAPVHMSRQRAGAVAALGLQYMETGDIQTATEHQPEYLRLSQAEREQIEKEAKRNDN